MSSLPDQPCKRLALESLAQGVPTMPPDSAGFFIDNCIVCLDSQGHASGVELQVKTDDNNVCLAITWAKPMTEQLRRAFGNDHRRTTDSGAVALALLLIRELTEYTAIEQAGLGTTIDYYLSTKPGNDTLIFNETEAYLEVRGIRKETKGNTVRGAIAKKIRRLGTPDDLPVYVVVVEFGKPFSRMTCNDQRKGTAR